MSEAFEPVRWGILGAARIADGAILPAMARSRYCTPFAIAARDIGRANAMAQKFGAQRSFGSYHELLQNPDIEAVYIALPNHLHVEWARAATDAGKHVLVEKPIGLTAKDLAALDGVNPRLRIAEAFMVRHQPRWQALKDILRSGKYGAPRTVSSLLSFMMTKADDFRTRPEWGGGAVYDLGCYTAVAARFVFNREPLRVLAETARDQRGIDMFSSIILDFGGGDHAIVAVSLAQASAQTLQIVCGRGYIDLPKAYVPSRTEPNLIHIDISPDHANSEITTRSFPPLDQYEAEVSNFSRSVRGEDVPFYGLDDARANMTVIDAIFASAEKGAWAIVASGERK
jgi:predicted dehydrogenase